MSNLSLVVNNGITMSSLEMVALINSVRKDGEAELRHADFLTKVPKVLGGGERNFSSSYKSTQNKDLPCYNFPKREACLMAMSYSYELQAAVYDRWQELEGTTTSKLPATFAEALRLAAQLEEERQLAITQRDLAIATKAEIGSRREATAMNTASQAVKKVSALEVELDRSREFATVKKMEILYKSTFNWRLLKKYSIEADIEIKRIPDANYGEVNAYHQDAWLAVYGIDCVIELETD